MLWCKGFYYVYGIYIDIEWCFDWKWDWVLLYLVLLVGRQVLDVGCGSGYYLWCMYGEGVVGVYGIDFMQLFLIQFLVIKYFIGVVLVYFLFLGIEQMQLVGVFDIVFLMGVFYYCCDFMEFL